MTATIDYINKGEKFTAPVKPKEEIEHLIKFRHQFKREYQRNRLIFPKDLCEKIDKSINTVDEFIETYNNGLIDFPEEDIKRNAELNKGMYIAGIWGANEFDNIMDDFKKIRMDIENEFRKIYGTTE
jgi:hypothetical protein